MTKLCVKCGNDIPAGRLEALPHTTTCVACSSVTAKAGRMVTYGVGEEIHTEIEVLERGAFEAITSLELTRGHKKPRAIPKKIVNFEDDDEPSTGKEAYIQSSSDDDDD